MQVPTLQALPGTRPLLSWACSELGSLARTMTGGCAMKVLRVGRRTNACVSGRHKPDECWGDRGLQETAALSAAMSLIGYTMKRIASPATGRFIGTMITGT